jgi:hypothetical protein
VQKLGIKAGAKVGIFDAPPGFDRTLGALPEGVTRVTRLGGPLDVALFFTTSERALDKRFAALAKAIAPAGGLWICWPKKSSGVKTDLNDNVVRAVGLGKGLVDVKVCAVDETWSGLKFVVRLADRPKQSSRAGS